MKKKGDKTMTWTLEMPMREKGESRKRKWAQAGRWKIFTAHSRVKMKRASWWKMNVR